MFTLLRSIFITFTATLLIVVMIVVGVIVVALAILAILAVLAISGNIVGSFGGVTLL